MSDLSLLQTLRCSSTPAVGMSGRSRRRSMPRRDPEIARSESSALTSVRVLPNVRIGTEGPIAPDRRRLESAHSQRVSGRTASRSAHFPACGVGGACRHARGGRWFITVPPKVHVLPPGGRFLRQPWPHAPIPRPLPPTVAHLMKANGMSANGSPRRNKRTGAVSAASARPSAPPASTLHILTPDELNCSVSAS